MDTYITHSKNRKEFTKIMNLNPFQVVDKILKHYTCPESCGAACCQKLSIPITYPEVKVIEKNSRVNRKILDTLVFPTGKYEVFKDVGFNEKANGSFKIFPVKPCPFLNPDNLCNIHKRKPLACRVYPFNIIRKPEKPDELNFKINLCELGFNFYLDYVPFLYQTTINNPNIPIDTETLKDIAQNMRENENFLIDKVEEKKNNFDDMGYIVIQELDLLKMFLLWLDIIGEGRIETRNEFKSILLEKKEHKK